MRGLLEQVIKAIHPLTKSIISIGQPQPLILPVGHTLTRTGDVKHRKQSITPSIGVLPCGQRKRKGGDLCTTRVEFEAEEVVTQDGFARFLRC